MFSCHFGFSVIDTAAAELQNHKFQVRRATDLQLELDE